MGNHTIFLSGSMAATKSSTSRRRCAPRLWLKKGILTGQRVNGAEIIRAREAREQSGRKVAVEGFQFGLR